MHLFLLRRDIDSTFVNAQTHYQDLRTGGLSSREFIPMPGVHKSLNPTAKSTAQSNVYIMPICNSNWLSYVMRGEIMKLFDQPVNVFYKLLVISCFFSCFFIAGCVDSFDSISEKNELHFDFLKIKKVTLIKKFKNKSGLIELQLILGDKPIVCYGRFNSKLIEEIYRKKIINEISLRKDKENTLIIEKITTDLGILGFLQYWLAFSWLSLFLPYTIAHAISYAVPIIGFILLLLIGIVFVEF